MPIKLYRLLCELAIRGRVVAPLATLGGVLVPLPLLLPLSPTRFECDLDLVEDSVVAGEPLSNHELSVEVDLFAGRSLASPSLLELPDEADASVLASGPFVGPLGALDRRRMLRSLRKEGMPSIPPRKCANTVAMK